LALEEDIQTLSGVRLLESFTKEQLRLIAFGAENLNFGAGQELYHEGDPAETAFIITHGSVRLFRDQDGRQVTVGLVGPGAMLGEIALITETRRLTSAVAEVDTYAIRLNRKMFLRILEEFPDLAVVLHRRIAEDFHALVSRIERLAPRFN
jgi:CRP-like cAMP-binding protein